MDRLAAMEAFVRVVDAGSFSGAAKQLRLGQPAVSKTIAQLEDRLGVRLLLRSTHRLMPTEAGRNFYERAKRAVEQADEAELAARGAAITLSGRLGLPARNVGNHRYRERASSGQRYGGCSRGGACRPGLCYRLRVGVRVGAEIRSGPGCAYGLGIAAG